MFRKLVSLLLAVGLILSACAVALNTSDPGVFSTPNHTEAEVVVSTQTPIRTFAPTLTPTPAVTSSSTPTPEPSPTPIPTSVPGEFEFPFQPGFIPAELEAGGLGEVTFGVAKSAGGEISTEGMKSQNIIPLVKDSATLNAVSGNVVFLPFPEKMLTEDGQEVSYSVDQSGQGWAAYIDANGNLLRKMVTRIPNGGTIVAGVSFNPSDRGTVYAVKLNDSGEILGKARVVFDAQTSISLVFEAGKVDINIGGNVVTPDYSIGRWLVDPLATLDNNLRSAGVIFTPDTTNKIDLGYGSFTLKFSQGILKRSGVKYIKLHPQVMENFFLQAMGEFMYFNRDYYPDRYKDFFSFQLSPLWTVNTLEDPTIIRKLAKKILESGPAPIRFDVGSMQGSVNEIDMYLVSKDEFLNSVLPTLDTTHTYIHNLGWLAPGNWDLDAATFIEGNRLIVVGYYLGIPNETPLPWFRPLEISYGDNIEYLYWGIYNNWRNMVALLQVGMAPGSMKYEAHQQYGKDKDMICLGADANAGNTKKCLPYIRYTFTRGLPIPPTPTPP